MSSRIGRKYAQATYPQSRATQSEPFARNSAFGPNGNAAISSTANPPTQAVDWETIESGEAGGGPTFTVTPKVSGTLLINVVVNATNTTGAAIELSAVVTIDGAPVDQVSFQSIPLTTGAGSVAILDVVTENAIGVPVTIGVRVSGNGLTLTGAGTWISVQEVPAASS